LAPSTDSDRYASVIAQLPGSWQPRDLAFAHDTVVRVARFEREFAWHQHEEDERPKTLQYGN
jgi:hypothetical protein